MGCPSAGGCGGKGGDVVARCMDGSSLAQFKTLGYRRHIAGHGDHFKKNKGDGKPGRSSFLSVPAGTVVYDGENNLLKELNTHGEQMILARGGHGGSHKTLKFNGIKGERKIVTFELKLLGDVGLVGFPNAGKSTFLQSVSNATPKVADYPFTTLRPTVGLIKYPDHTTISYTDLPGLIEDAYLNRGMGHKFLRHVERTKVILMMVDINGFQLNSQFPLRSPVETITLLLQELYLYQKELMDREILVALNKVDTEPSGELVARIKHQMVNITKMDLPFLRTEESDIIREKVYDFTSNGFSNVFGISAKAGIGLEILTDNVRSVVEQLKMDEELE
eukprot:gene14078-5065_t